MFLAVLIGALTLGVQHSAYAITIQLSDGAAPPVTCADGDACDSNPIVGAVTFIGSVGNFVLNVSTAITYPVLGSAGFGIIDLNSVNVTSNAGGELTLLASEANFTGPIIGGTAPFIFSVVGGTAGTANFAAFLDDNNALFGMTSSLGTLGPFGGAFSGTTEGIAIAAAPFSLTTKAVFEHPGGFPSVSFSHASLTATPEPASLLLLGSGLMGLGLLGRKRFRLVKPRHQP
jgi:hypothetical protein